MSHLYSYSQVARELGVDYRLVSGLVDALGIEPKAHPSNGRAKALDDRDLETIRRALSVRAEPQPIPAV